MTEKPDHPRPAGFKTALTQEQHQAATQWLRDNTDPSSGCPLCDNDRFTVLNTLYAMPAYIQERGVYINQTLPCIVSLCDRCGYLMFHSSIKAGITANDPMDQKEESGVKSS